MASAFLGCVSNKLVAAALSAALERSIVSREEYEERKHEPQFAYVDTLDLAKFAELSYAPAFGKFGDVYGESGRKITVYVQTITGRTFELEIGCDSYVEEVKYVLEESQDALVDSDRFILLFKGTKLENGRRISEYGVVEQSTLEFTVDLRGSGPTPVLVLDDESVRDPVWDYDFTDQTNDGAEYYRGGERYYRPYGWNRVALKVDTKFDGDIWLGTSGLRTDSSPGEWPVSYHGTSRENTNGIAEQGYLLSKGWRHMYGPGIYSSPSIDVAAIFASAFTHEGVGYKVVFQNRVSKDGLKKANNDEYWVQPNEKLIRPYGLCIQCVNY